MVGSPYLWLFPGLNIMNRSLPFLDLISDVTVSLQQIMQSVVEGDGNVDVCVELEGATLARSVTITLTPQPGTASKF